MARILLIEDEPELRKTLCHVLVRDGHFVSEAEDGRTGAVRLARERFDLVITNILMPEVDGVEVIQMVRRLHPGTRILAMSGSGRTSAHIYLALAAKLGAHKSLAKPFSPEELLANVRELVGKSSPYRPADSWPSDIGRCLMTVLS